MTVPEPLHRVSVVDELAASLRQRILDGEFSAGAPLREVELAETYAVSRHTLRAALRSLAGEGIVVIEANRGARVARLDAEALAELFELRIALELEAAYLVLERHGGRLPADVHESLAQLVAACRRRRVSWRTVADAHAQLHGSIVSASGSPRIIGAYAALAVELQLFLAQLRPVWSLDRMVDHHQVLVAELEAHGPSVLRSHLRDGLDAVASSTA